MGLWQNIFHRFSQGSEARQAAELARLAHLKEIARACRTDNAAQRREEEGAGIVPSLSLLASRRKRLEDAEGRYALAVQAWTNKEWRIKG